MTQLLRARFAAAARSDESGWLAPLQEASSAALRLTQAAVLDRMTRMAVESIRLVGVRETTAPVPASRGTTVEWDVRASLTYRLRGFDARPRSFDLDLTFKADPGRPGGLAITASSPSGRPQPWDLAGLVVRRSHTALVLAVGDADRVQEVVRRARTAASRVASVWGEVRPAVWIAPATDADAARLLGRTAGDLDGVAAATDGPLTPGERAGADRIVLVPGAWASLRPDGRDVVMTHELTHVAVRASTTRAVPLWLSEGFAELVAYEPSTCRRRRSSLPRSTVCEHPACLRHCRQTRTSTRAPTRSRRHTASRCWPCAPSRTRTAPRPSSVSTGPRPAGSTSRPPGSTTGRQPSTPPCTARPGRPEQPSCADWQARIRDLLR